MCILSIELVIDDYIVNSIIRAKEVNEYFNIFNTKK